MKRTLWILAVAVSFSACDSKATGAPAPEAQHDSHESAGATAYVCPMHPDVTDTKPSKCPKCGMTLEPKK